MEPEDAVNAESVKRDWRRIGALLAAQMRWTGSHDGGETDWVAKWLLRDMRPRGIGDMAAEVEVEISWVT